LPATSGLSVRDIVRLGPIEEPDRPSGVVYRIDQTTVTVVFQKDVVSDEDLGVSATQRVSLIKVANEM